MSSAKEKLDSTIIERWVKNVLQEKPSSSLELIELHDLFELTDQQQLAKRSKPSYEWHPDPQDKWWRIWFQESNLTIQIDLHFSDGKLQQNHYEIDLEQCSTGADILHWLYHVTIHKAWSSPEMLWALMEVIEEASDRVFGERIADACLDRETLDWANSKP